MIFNEKEIIEYAFIENAKQKEITKEILKLAQEHPDYPIVVLAGECASDGDHSWTYCESVTVKIDRILGCETPWWYRESVCSDHEDFEDSVKDNVWSKLKNQLGREPTDEEFEETVKEVLKAHEPYWINVIAIFADNY